MRGVIEFPPVVAGDDIDVSATTYLAFLQCPESAAARLRGEYGPESRASFKGGLSHRIFARHLRSGPIPPGEFEQACREEIGSGMNPKLGALGLRPSELQAVIAEVGALYERFRQASTEGFAGAEVQIEATPAPGVRLKGSIDAVFEEDGATRLVDWKTGGVGERAVDQLDFYTLLWALDREELPAVVEAVSVGTGQRAESVPTRADAERTAGRVAAMIDALRTSWDAGVAVERTGGPWCRYCPLLDGCAEGRAATTILGGGPGPGPG